MKPEPPASLDARPPAGSWSGAGADLRLDALLAAAFLACSAPAGLAAERPGQRCPPEEDASWIASASALARDEVSRARRAVERWWSSARSELLGIPRPAAEPRLLVYEVPPRVEAARDGRIIRSWAELTDASDFPSPSVVLLVHGLDETGFIWDDLAPELVRAGYHPVSFEYANDQPIARSAEQLAEALRRLRRLGVERATIVGHSMGGLAARDALTRPGLLSPDDGPRITRLILLATPNGGSALAVLQPLSEIREHVARAVDGAREAGSGWVRSSGDGSGEAAADLEVDSPYLLDLNARGLPQAVPITNIVASLVSGHDRARVRASLANNLAGLLDPEAAAEVSRSIEAAIERVGDGIVSLDSMRLEGVVDTVEVKANHRSMIRRIRLSAAPSSPGEPLPPAIPIILQRLAEDDPRPERPLSTERSTR